MLRDHLCWPDVARPILTTSLTTGLATHQFLGPSIGQSYRLTFVRYFPHFAGSLSCISSQSVTRSIFRHRQCPISQAIQMVSLLPTGKAPGWAPAKHNFPLLALTPWPKIAMPVWRLKNGGFDQDLSALSRFPLTTSDTDSANEAS